MRRALLAGFAVVPSLLLAGCGSGSPRAVPVAAPVGSGHASAACAQWSSCMPQLARQLGAPALAPPAGTKDVLVNTILSSSQRDTIGYSYLFRGHSDKSVFVQGSAERSTIIGPNAPRASVRGRAGSLAVVGSNAIYTWREQHRVWRVVFPPTMKSAAERRELRQFATYRS